MKKILLALVSLLILASAAYGQKKPNMPEDAPPNAPQPIVFPEPLKQYLPDSIRNKFPQIIERAMREGLPSEYLYSFLPDSIAKMLPDSIERFIPKEYDQYMQPTRNFTAEDLMSMKRISDPQVSPDGKWIVFTLKKPSIKANKFYTDLYYMDSSRKITKRLTTHARADYNPRFSPDGKKLAFISSRSKPPQAFVMDFPDGEPKKITDMPHGVSNLSWSPDGKYFAFTSEVKLEKNLTDLYPNRPKAKVRIYDDLPIRHWNEWTDCKYSHLFIMPVSGGEPKDLMQDEKYDTPLKPFGGAEQIAWSPDGKEIAYVSKKVDDFVESTNSDVYVYDIESGKTKNITKGMLGFDLNPQYSPDGEWIAFISLRRAGFESDKHRLMLYERDSEEIFELSKTIDNWVGEFAWTPDSRAIYFTAGDKGKIKLFAIGVDDYELSDDIELDQGDWTVVADGWYNYGGGLQFLNEGENLLIGRQSMTEPVDLYQMTKDGEDITQITQINDNVLRKLTKTKIEETWIESVDGAKVQCWIVYPPDFDSTKKYPLITYCQGGPQSMIGQRFHYRWNYYLIASHGYVMIMPNRRGLPGFGQDWNDAISKHWGDLPMQDIMSATDYMKKKSFIDTNASAAIGASAGGYAAFWLAGNHKGRYDALVSHCGVFNLESMYGATEELWFPNWEYGGPYWKEENREIYEKHSPHKYAQNWDTPILIITGEGDYRVPYTQSLEAFTVAQVKGIDSKLMIFPEETHFVVHPQEFCIWDSEFFKFLDKHCK